METLEAINKRASLKTQLSAREVEQEKIIKVLDAARLAPSARNQQPWRFIVIKKEDRKFYTGLFNCLSPGNRIWAKNVPVLVLSVAETISSYNKKMNKYAFHDVGLAVSNLILQATALGLFVHQMGGYDNEKARNNLKIPPGFDPVAVIAIGYLADSYTPPPGITQGRHDCSRFLYTFWLSVLLVPIADWLILTQTHSPSIL